MTTGTLDITEARREFNRLDERLREEQVIYITRHNQSAFAIVDLEFLTTVLETIEIMSDPESYEIFQQSIEDIRNGRVHDHDDVKRELLGDGAD